MILIVVPQASERAALVGLCETRALQAIPCATLREFRRVISAAQPRVVVVRQRLPDGAAEDVLSLMHQRGGIAPRVLVLLSATASTETEARQVVLGSDQVLRDPVRAEVLLAYIERYIKERRAHAQVRPAGAFSFRFAGATLDPRDRTIRHGRRATRLTPREVQLAQQLALAAGQVVDYAALYQDILDRPYRGETSNMRVLLGKLAASLAAIGIALRDCVEVIPKAGYRYTAPPQ